MASVFFRSLFNREPAMMIATMIGACAAAACGGAPARAVQCGQSVARDDKCGAARGSQRLAPCALRCNCEDAPFPPHLHPPLTTGVGSLTMPFIIVPIRRSMGLPTYQWDGPSDPDQHPVRVSDCRD